MKRLLNFYKRLALIVSALLFVFFAFVPVLPAHAEGDATDDTVQTTEAPKAAEPASPPAPDPDPPAEVAKEVVTDNSEVDADAEAAKLAADKAAAEAAEAKAKAEAEAEAAKAAADKAAADATAAKVAAETTDPVVEDPPAEAVVGDPGASEEVVEEESVPDPEPAEPATTSSATACVFSDALIRVTVTTGDGEDHVGDVDVDGTQVSPETGGKVPGVFFVDNQNQDSVLVRVTAKDAPFSGTVNVASSCSGGSGDNGGDPGDPGDGSGGDPGPEPAGPLPESVDDVDVSTTVNEQVTFMVAEWDHIDDVFRCEPNNGEVFDAWGVNPEVYYLPNEGFIGTDEFTCTVTRDDKSLTWNVKVTVTELDSDGDGTPDGDDAFPNDPKESKDSDKDGVGDNADAFPRDPKETKDSDEDGVGDNTDKCESTPAGESVDANGCSASQRDTDHDGLTDAEEAELGTNPAKADTDSDGYSDGVEVEEGTNPLDPNSHPGDVRPPQPESVFTQKTVEDKSCKKGLRTQLQDFVSDPTWVNSEWVFGEPVLLESGPWVKVRSLTKSEKAELKCPVGKDKDADKGKEPNTGPQSKTGDLPDEDDGDDPGLTQYVVAVVQGAVVFLALGAVMLVFSLRRKEQEAI